MRGILRLGFQFIPARRLGAEHASSLGCPTLGRTRAVNDDYKYIPARLPALLEKVGISSNNILKNTEQ